MTTMGQLAPMIEFGVWQGRLSPVIRLQQQAEQAVDARRLTNVPDVQRFNFPATDICSDKSRHL